MFFANTLLLSACMLPTVLGAPSAVDASLGARVVTGPADVVAAVASTVHHAKDFQGALAAMAMTSPQSSGVLQAVSASQSLLKGGMFPPNGMVSGSGSDLLNKILSGHGSTALAPLSGNGLLAVILTLSPVNIIQAGSVASCLGVLGGLLTTILSGDTALLRLIAALNAIISLGGANSGCGCTQAALATLISIIQALLASLLTLTNVVNSCPACTPAAINPQVTELLKTLNLGSV
ncbi:hypothetical protein C8R46DRAFT_1326701 [Mycena filopes]|nr:hypothetical protein C8R46DRAFT_1326701 [Mycena filopes]